MKPIKHVEELLGLLKERLPDATLKVDEPADPNGIWIVDVNAGGRYFVFEFTPNVGFGLSSINEDSGYGERPDEVYLESANAVARLVELVRNDASTEPMRQRFLQELRELASLSQVELAGRLGMKQPTLSKLESRETISLESLHRIARALGGKVHVTVELRGRTFDLPPERIVREPSEPPQAHR